MARGSGRGRPGDLRARLREPGRERLREGVRYPPGRRPDQEPLRGADLHPAGTGAAQARPADEVQPAARDRRRPAGRGRGRLDRAGEHDPSDRRHAEGRRGEGGPPADLGAADSSSLPLRNRHVDQRGDGRPRPLGRPDRSRAGRRLARLPVDRGRLRGDRSACRTPLRRLLHRPLPARRRRRRKRQVRLGGDQLRRLPRERQRPVVRARRTRPRAAGSGAAVAAGPSA